MIQITADTRRAVVTNKELLTVGSAGIQVQFTLSEDWDTLSKLAVFRVGDDGLKVDVVLGESLTCVVPPEVLTQEDEVLFIGVYGTNGQGTVIIPTVWASAGVVKPGTEPNTPAEAQPTPEIWAQILGVAQDAEQTATEAMSAVEAGLQDLSALEGNVETAEAQRVVNEQDRVAAEQQRVLAENNREAAETARTDNEEIRVNAEADRAAAETARASAETARASAEASRVTAEEGRVAAEAYREEKYAEYVTTVQGYANAASTSATSAAGSATDAASSASSASTSAVQAASSASSASTSASQASSSASSASTSATTASNAATAATTKAGEAAASATAAGNAQTAAETAQTAAETAQSAAEGAQAAAETAAESIEESAAQIAQNTQDISDAKNAISQLIVSYESETTPYNNGSVNTGTGLTANRRWFCSYQVPANTTIHSIGLKVYGSYTSNNTPLGIELFTFNEGTLTRVKTINTIIPTESAGTSIEIDCEDVSYNYPVMIALQQGRTIATLTPGSGTTYYTSDIASETLTFANLSTFSGELNIDVTIIEDIAYWVGDPSPNIVHIGEGFKYVEIQDAIDDIIDDSAANPYTLIIHPKATSYSRFSTIRKLSEPYPWIDAPIRYISMIGLDKYHCVIEDKTGNYSKPPAEILTNGLIKNLTFKATHANQDTTALKGAYAVHIDAEPVGNVGYEMQFEDCVFESDQTAGVGIGLHNACHLQFLNCEFISTASESYSPHSGYNNLAYLGAFNCHSSTNQSDTDQLLTLVNCVAMANENKAYNLSTNANCYMTLKAFGNTFWCTGTGQANGYKGSYCTVFGANHGNNATVLNAISAKQDATSYVTLSGTIVTQTGADNTMYLCGELAELTFTAPATGQTAIRFTSGTTPTVATFSGVTWLNGFDPTAIEASKTYEVNILNGLGCAAWT